MKDWLIGGGARFDKMKIVNFNETYRGVITTKPIKVNLWHSLGGIADCLCAQKLNYDSINGKKK